METNGRNALAGLLVLATLHAGSDVVKKQGRQRMPAGEPPPAAVKELLLKIGRRTKELRRRAGITQDYFHRDLGINISRVEAGSHNVSVGTLLRICCCLDISIEDFFKGIKG